MPCFPRPYQAYTGELLPSPRLFSSQHLKVWSQHPPFLSLTFPAATHSEGRLICLSLFHSVTFQTSMWKKEEGAPCVFLTRCHWRTFENFVGVENSSRASPSHPAAGILWSSRSYCDSVLCIYMLGCWWKKLLSQIVLLHDEMKCTFSILSATWSVEQRFWLFLKVDVRCSASKSTQVHCSLPVLCLAACFHQRGDSKNMLVAPTCPPVPSSK